MPYNIPNHLKGLTEAQLKSSQNQFGYNEVEHQEKDQWYHLLLDILKEPMLLLLIAVAIIYIIVGNTAEAAFMLAAIVAVTAISFYQDNRSKKALQELEKLNESLSTVIRDGKVIQIPTRELAVGDLCVIEEGKMLNADGRIVHSNDFSVNESSLTGESFSVFKSSTSEDPQVYSGTLVVSGLAVFEVEKIGRETQLGKIGQSIHSINEERSPLYLQINRFVKNMAIFGTIIFLMVCIFSYVKTQNILDSLLSGLTMAMSVLPEEIPVAFTTFMALGAWKLMREGVIIKRSSVVETLGSTTVICTDKTGTITENAMQLQALYNFKTDRIYDSTEFHLPEVSNLIAYAMWSSEPVPFDPMEKTLHRIYLETHSKDERTNFQMIHEYPLGGKPPMMTHLFENESGERIIAAKGAPEAILEVSDIPEIQKVMLREKILEFGKNGWRVLGVAKAQFMGNDFPEKQQDFNFEFLGFTGFYDPPKKDINEVFRKIDEAGIKVKIITGDRSDTTEAIAQQAGISQCGKAVNGSEIISKSDLELQELSAKTTLFTRMFPEAKLAVINTLKRNEEVVAMLGDGVNDAPALKAAHIGVAMGNKGTEIAKAAASLVNIDDDLGKLITGIAAGRRIKAIQYIISIHIPIILTVSLPPFLGWIYPQIFTPVHVIFLELIMGPTCSIVYENEPLEKNAMQQKPRKMTDTFLNAKELSISIIQGLMITLGVLLAYQYSVQMGGSEEKTRAIVFTTLIFSNIFLSYVNRSFYYSVLETFKNRNILLLAVSIVTLLFLSAILFIDPVTRFFKVTTLSASEIGFAALVAFASVIWFEGLKLWKRMRKSEG